MTVTKACPAVLPCGWTSNLLIICVPNCVAYEKGSSFCSGKRLLKKHRHSLYPP